MTEAICREVDAKKADYLIYDPTSIEVFVAESNPKLLNGKLKQAKQITRKNPDLNPHALAYSLMPEIASSILVNNNTSSTISVMPTKLAFCPMGLGIVRDVAFFD